MFWQIVGNNFKIFLTILSWLQLEYPLVLYLTILEYWQNAHELVSSSATGPRDIKSCISAQQQFCTVTIACLCLVFCVEIQTQSRFFVNLRHRHFFGYFTHSLPCAQA